MFGLGTPELMIILVIVMLLFGANKVPQLMKGLGDGMKEFKKATKDDDEVVVRTVDNGSITTHKEPRV